MAGAQKLIEFSEVPDPADPDRAIAPTADSVPDPTGSFEFEFAPADLARLLRAPAIAARREGRIRTTAHQTIWHDTATAELAAAGVSLGEQPGRWRLERLRPNGAADWHPATPAPLLDEAATPAALRRPVDGPLVPVAAFAGCQRVAALAGPATLTILEGTLRGVASDRPTCRLILSGGLPDMATLAAELADTIPLVVPRAGLAAEAMAVASGMAPTPRRIGAPRVTPTATVEEALSLVVAHLADVILHWARSAPAGTTPEPVHQMRVAVRRLRTAVTVFRGAAGATLDDIAEKLRALAAALAPARDWDVFLEATGAAVGRAFVGDRRIETMLAAAERQRRDAYAGLAVTLASADFHRLCLALALLPSVRPWALGSASSPQLQEQARTYAARMLNRRLKHLAAPGPSLAALPTETLHHVRKQAKRLRYAAEFFTPLFPEKPTRRFLRRLASVQEALGTLNDAAVTRSLMVQLGADRTFAGGAVQGFVAAHSVKAGAIVEHAWGKFRRQPAFWK